MVNWLIVIGAIVVVLILIEIARHIFIRKTLKAVVIIAIIAILFFLAVNFIIDKGFWQPKSEAGVEGVIVTGAAVVDKARQGLQDQLAKDDKNEQESNNVLKPEKLINKLS